MTQTKFSLRKPPTSHQAQDKQTWRNLSGSHGTFALAHAALQAQAPLVLVTPTSEMAHRLARELRVLKPSDKLSIFTFEDWETLPYDNFSPHQDIISDRLSVLSRIPSLKSSILVVPISTVLHRLAPKNYIHAMSFDLKVGMPFNWDIIRHQLVTSGYQGVSQVMHHGEFAIRGSLIDIFPMGEEQPIRIDLFDDEIDTLRLFDPETQRSSEKIDQFTCLPAREFPLTEQAITLFRKNFRSEFSGDPSVCTIYQNISQGIPSAGIEYYLPLFFENTNTLLEYLPSNSIIVRYGDIEHHADAFWQEVNLRYEQFRHDRERPILSPSKLFIKTNEFFGQLTQFSQIIIPQSEQATLERAKKGHDFYCDVIDDIAINNRLEQPLNKFSTFLENHRTANVLLCAESAGRREMLLELLQRHHLHPKSYPTWQDFFASDERFGITVAPIESNIWLTDCNWMMVSEGALYGQQVMQRRYRQKTTQDPNQAIRNLAELSLNQAVVHIEHGVGRYQGLVNLTIENTEGEYVVIEYADHNKLYLPVSSLHLLSQYSGAQETLAPLHRLGTDQWEKAKRKAAEKAQDVAAELLNIYAQRAMKKGHAFDKTEDLYYQFSSGFGFEETPDQAKAIEDVINDLQADKPMDRLVCGDVGFGKTEVALRAAFIAVQNSKQVVLLVPTTLLAQQHYETFCDRFADWPVKIGALSRFRSKKEQDEIIASLKNGQIDIIIGTHKLIQENIQFKALGLVIIDEEHRFGVKQKEKLKAMRAEVDILTLTATPIPRTLNMAMSQLRDLSIIATPPAKRLSIKTFVREYQQGIVHEAILRELMRGGQIYYLHNDVKTIENIANELRALIPQARVGFAHGQMRERQLEQVMSDFYHQRFNVLVCTTIIETGIDIPSANTIIINRADKFGLAQLHQLRGRVGRSHHQAYAYCLTPPQKLMSADAHKRLDALQSLEELGSGFTLATHDLEIRGAGELLGDEQSGNIQAIGFSLYMELLDRAIRSLKSGKKLALDAPLHRGAEVNLHVSALIPDKYLPDVHNRLVLYKRIANAKTPHDLEALQIEMIDRFGLLPEPVKNLFKITELKLLAEPIGIVKIEASETVGRIVFEAEPNLDPMVVLDLIRLQPKHYKLNAQNQIKFFFEMPNFDERYQTVVKILSQLTGVKK